MCMQMLRESCCNLNNAVAVSAGAVLCMQMLHVLITYAVAVVFNILRA